MTKCKYIEIKGARVHNLKSVDVNIPLNQFVVITGVSGSGKSSLAFDTLYAEGQRRYIESLSSYARQFLGRIDKPEVDFIKGIPPAVAIEQKVNTRNPRSTVGTSTEIYDYLKLLFARIGRTFSPISNEEVKKHTVTDVVDFILSKGIGTRIAILSPILIQGDRTLLKQLEILQMQGFSRVEKNGEFIPIEEVELDCADCLLLIDRIQVEDNEDFLARIADSIQTAFFEGNGACIIKVFGEDIEIAQFTNRFEADGRIFDEPSDHLFSFNNPAGACPKCEGFGAVLGIDADLVIPDKSLTLLDGAIACWRGEVLSEWNKQLINNAHRNEISVHTPYFELTEREKQLIWHGGKGFGGIFDFFKEVESQLYKIQYRVLYSRFRGKTLCPDCNGSRLKKEASWVKINGYSISEFVLMPLDKLKQVVNGLELNEFEQKLSVRLLKEILQRLDFLLDVGLGYLTLNRLSASLSGGESQRINLATSLGSSLVGSLYVLDEPSIGLHSRDTIKLISVLKKLRDVGNTVVVVEHDEDIIREADYLIDIGPKAGIHGGELVFEGTMAELYKKPDTITAKFLAGVELIKVPSSRRAWTHKIELVGACENNLKNVSVNFPLNIMVAVTGVSGSGKSSLIKSVFYPALNKALGNFDEKGGAFVRLKGDIKNIKEVEFVDQNPIGKSTRSNPVTYLKVYDDIRKIYSELPFAKKMGFKPGYFSFNVPGGRCEECEGEGFVKVEMQFMADVVLQCEHCKGSRFSDDVLEVKYHDKSISDLLELSISEAVDFFKELGTSQDLRIANRLKPLLDVGLGYVKMGQSSSTLSGGESQRVKLASFLAKDNGNSTMFIFDEPTTGLHFNDVRVLLDAFSALVEKGHSLIIIEHNLDVIKCADWVIDLGPEGGEKGGNLLYSGTPEGLMNVAESHTGHYLKKHIYR